MTRDPFRMAFYFAVPVTVAALLAGCSTSLPTERHSTYLFPQSDVYVEQPVGPHAGQPLKPLGWVKTRVPFRTLEQAPNNPALCRNYYNKGAAQLLKEARKVGADAVVQVRSVVLLFSGQVQEFPTPECSDDGAEGEILLKGIAVKYLPFPSPTPFQATATPSPRPRASPTPGSAKLPSRTISN